MQKQEIEMTIANAAADIMNFKQYANMKNSLLDLYSDRLDFYSKAKFPFEDYAIKMGISDQRTYGRLCSVLASYKDKYTVDEVTSGFCKTFYSDIRNSIFIDKLGKKKSARIEISIPKDPDSSSLARLLSVYEYLTNVCSVGVTTVISNKFNLIDLSRVPKGAPQGVFDDIRRLSMNSIMFLEGYRTQVNDIIADTEKDKVLIAKFSCNTPFYEACLFGMRGLFEPGFFENDFALASFKAGFDMNANDFLMYDCLLDCFNKFDVDLVPTVGVSDRFKAGGYSSDEVDKSGVYACMRSCFARSMLGMAKYSDDFRLIQTTGLTKQEIRRVIASTYLWAEKVNVAIPTRIENNAKCSLIINDMVQNGIALMLRKNRKNAIASAYTACKRDEKVAAKGEKRKTKNDSSNLQRVLEENTRLKRELNQAKSEVKAKKDIERGVRSEMADMKKDFEARLKELEAELEKTKAENSDLQNQLDDDEFVSDDEHEITKEDILKAAEGKTVLVWGVRSEIAERLVSEYGDIVNCIATDDYQNGLLPSGAVDKCDAAIIVTNYSSHTRYWKARDEIKASGKPYAHLRRNINSPERIGKLIWKVLSGEVNRNL